MTLRVLNLTAGIAGVDGPGLQIIRCDTAEAQYRPLTDLDTRADRAIGQRSTPRPPITIGATMRSNDVFDQSWLPGAEVDPL